MKFLAMVLSKATGIVNIHVAALFRII